LISLFRLFSVPILYVFAFMQMRTEFTILFTLVAISDAVDGFFARLLKQTDEFGARLDSTADECFYDSTVIWLFVLIPQMFIENLVLWGLLIFLGLLTLVLMYKKIGIHSIANKITAVAFITFAIYSLIFGYNIIFFHIVMIPLILAAVEGLAMYAKYNGEVPPEARSVFFE